MRVAIVIPTYNEAGSIGVLLGEVWSVLKEFPQHEWHVVVVDANSPDGTGDIVRTSSTRYQNIHLIVETEKGGIAMAYAAGITYGIKKLRADAFISFDGDGQHDPLDIPRLMIPLEQGYDCAIGSRYVPGGGVSETWAWYRKFLSRFGGLYARLLLELPVHDVTSGLRATRVRGFGEYLPLTPERLVSRQYAYIYQFLYVLLQHGARVVEIPIFFRQRESGISKFTFSGIIENLRVTAVLRLQTLKEWRLLRVLAIGGVGFLFQAALFEILGIRLRVLDPSTVVILVAETAVFTNFFLHERFSFRDRRERSAPLIGRFVRFNLLCLGSIVIQWAAVRGTELLIGHVPLYLRTAYVLGVGLGLIVNYAGYYFWVWSNNYSKE